MKFIVKNITEITDVAKAILDYVRTRKIFSIYGELGAGKTTLIKELCKQLGVLDRGSSPTFSLVNEYKTRDGSSVYHLDLYRLRSENEIFDIGYEEFVYSGNYCFIEWPEKIEHLLPEETVRIRISVKNSVREIDIQDARFA